ncbi:hypothetical protein TIFTF001_018803 [Ficus carica]|uniref:Uncharacterized protein n=1 Tax=Ficus carica TaxID=3494 RepID=A0AA88AC46_FICCA|nr:hypothetical protein TIFTF001_018803 [Ficus carica]
MKSLKNLLLGRNNLTWINIGNMKTLAPNFTLSQMSLSSCGLKGEIPSWIPMQKRLNFLDLSENQRPDHNGGDTASLLKKNKESSSKSPWYYF